MKKFKQISCKDAEKLVVPYIEDSISEDETGAFINHVKNCRSCYEELETNFFVYYTLDLMESDRHSENDDVGRVLKEDLLRRENELSTYYTRNKIIAAIVTTAEIMLGFMILMDEVGTNGVSYLSQIRDFILALI